TCMLGAPPVPRISRDESSTPAITNGSCSAASASRETLIAMLAPLLARWRSLRCSLTSTSLDRGEQFDGLAVGERARGPVDPRHDLAVGRGGRAAPAADLTVARGGGRVDL